MLVEVFYLKKLVIEYVLKFKRKIIIKGFIL